VYTLAKVWVDNCSELNYFWEKVLWIVGLF
jgi:hypothetical protein